MNISFKQRNHTAFLLLLMLATVNLLGQDTDLEPSKVIFGCFSESIDEFEAFASRAKESGATHIVLTAEDLPWARWQYDTPYDPYPAWAISNVGLLKIATPEILKPYIPQDYAKTVLEILETRCRVLRKLGLKAAFTTFEPQMLPEAVFENYPQLRGPQVDQPMRSRVPRFAPAIDHPDVQDLYKESMQLLLKHCPEIEVISLHTNDSGSGISWSQGLYPGENGNPAFENKKMYERYFDFFSTLQKAALEMGNRLEIDAEWVREDYPELFATRLASGMALQNHEGPDGSRYKNTVGFLLDYLNPFDPVLGIPDPMRFLKDLQTAVENPAPRLFVLIGDRFNQDLYFEVYDRFHQKPFTGFREALDLLETVASGMVGHDNAHHLVDAWRNLYEVYNHRRLYNTGGYWFSLGSVHQRWLTRPFVPFPEELTVDETDYYRPFLFQARSETRARALNELQSTRFFEGWGGVFYHERIVWQLKAYLNASRKSLRRITMPPRDKADQITLLDKRLHAFLCVVENVRNAVVYQHFLDLSKEWKLSQRPMEQLQQLKGIWERRELMETARRELQNAQTIVELIESSSDPLFHTSQSAEEEDIRMLGPDLADQLKKKMKIMLAHWEDHERLFIAN